MARYLSLAKNLFRKPAGVEDTPRPSGQSAFAVTAGNYSRLDRSKALTKKVQIVEPVFAFLGSLKGHSLHVGIEHR